METSPRPTSREKDPSRPPLAAGRAGRAVPPLAGLALTAGLSLVPTGATANELGVVAVPTTSHIVIHDAAETLRSWCRTDAQGTTWFVTPGGVRVELVTSPSDPAITNHGDGAFHAFDAAEVASALAGVGYPLGAIAADVFILPFPPRQSLGSAAAPGLILLSPGVYPLPPAQQHAEFCHELGHVVQYARMPDRLASAWSRYRDLRAIGDTQVYWEGAEHADRPHEIFAEDFRALFGGAAGGSIENAALMPPGEVPGLAGFLVDLASRELKIQLDARPNPSRGAVVFRCAGSGLVPLDIFDVAGRRLVTLEARWTADGISWSWDGRDERGRDAGPGVFFARSRDAAEMPASSGVLRIIRLP